MKSPCRTVFDAIEKRDVSFVKSWLRKNNPNELNPVTGHTPLITAVEKTDVEMVKAILESHPDINYVSHNNSTALSTVVIDLMFNDVSDKHVQIIKLLLNAGANPNTGKNTMPCSPFYYIVQDKYVSIVKMFIEAGADVNSEVHVCGGHSTPLIMAANSLELTKLLVEAGADVNYTAEKDPRTALHFAVARKNIDVVRYLLDSGANPNPPQSKSILYEAYIHSTPDIVKLLIERGAVEGPSNFKTNVSDYSNIKTVINGLSDVENYLDYDWIQAQVEYIKSLSDTDKQVLKGYTYQGDVLVNSWLRGMFNETMFFEEFSKGSLYTPLFHYYKQKHNVRLETINHDDYIADLRLNYKTYVMQYADDLKRIIYNSPRSTKTMRVFRGIVRPKYFIDMTKQSEHVQTSDFQSCSINFEAATEFSQYANTNKYGMVLYILLTPGTPCLYMHSISSFGDEFEITLPPGVKLQHNPVLIKNIIDEDGNNTTVRLMPLKTIEWEDHKQ